MKYGNPQRRAAVVRDTLAPYHSFVFDDPAAEIYAQVRHDLESAGMRIGPHDLLIAAICLVNNCTIVTNNLSEFSRVKGLRAEDWTVPS